MMSLTKKNVVILGSEGVIGKSLSDYLVGFFNVTKFDIKLDPLHDLRSPEFITQFKSEIESADFVIFLAYDVGGARYLNSNQKNYLFLKNNTEIMLNVFDFLKTYNKKFIFASSEMSNEVNSAYGILKALGEDYTEALQGIFVRFWNVYNYESNKEKSHVITDFIDQALVENTIRMLTSGEESRQFLHSEDCAKAIYAVLVNYDEFLKTGSVDISSFESITIKELGEIIAGKTQSILIEGSKGDLTRHQSLLKPREEILKYWKPELSIEKGVDLVLKVALKK
jgi:nucleoside-diphosphate-sugar epimerase